MRELFGTFISLKRLFGFCTIAAALVLFAGISSAQLLDNSTLYPGGNTLPTTDTSGAYEIGANQSGASGDKLSAQNTLDNCGPVTKDGKISNPCPSGTRDDIDPGCVQTNNSGQCLNTMPTEGVSRVPEDVCYRTNRNRQHKGMDYAAPRGKAKVYAAADGIVSSKDCASGGGRTIYMTHSQGGVLKSAAEFEALQSKSNIDYKNSTYQTVYMHLDQILVRSGFVTKGTPIGIVGGSNCSAGVNGGKPVDDPVTSGQNGGAYGAHLHFEIHDGNGNVIDPMCSKIQGLCGGSQVDSTACRKNCKEASANCQKATYGVGSVQGAGGGASGQQAVSRDCSIDRFLSSYKTCVFCDIFKILFNTASDIAQRAFDALAKSVQNLVVMGTALWLAYTIFMYLSAMEVKEPRELLNNIIRQLFVVFVVYVLLSMKPSDFMALALEPIFNTGFKLAQIAVNADTCTNDYGIITTGGLPASMGNSIICTIASIQDEILRIMATGTSALCTGFTVRAIYGFIPHLGFVAIGLLLWISALLLLIIYPFLLVDVVLKLAVAAALMPAAIGCYAFKITRGYVGKIFETILNAMMAFVFLTIMIFVIKTQLDMVVGDSITDAINRDSEMVFLEELAWSALTPLKIMFIMLLGWAVLEEGEKFASQFASGLSFGGDIGRNVGGLGVGAAQKTAGWGAEKGKSLLKGVDNTLGNTAREKAHGAKHAARKWFVKKTGTDNGDGTFTRNTKSRVLFGKKVQKTVGTDGTYTREELGKKTKKVMTEDAYLRATVTTDRKSGFERVETGMLTAGGRSLINKDGKVHMVAYHNILQNSTLDPNLVKTALMNEMMSERMPGYVHLLNANHQSRTMKSSLDANGNEVFEVTQTNENGHKVSFKMTVSEKTGRAMLEIQDTNKDGSKTDVHATDGIINKSGTITRKKDKNGKIKVEEKAEYAFTDYYSKYSSKPMDSLGVADKNIPYHETLFAQKDQDALERRFYVTGRNADLTGFS